MSSSKGSFNMASRTKFEETNRSGSRATTFVKLGPLQLSKANAANALQSDYGRLANNLKIILLSRY